MSRSKAVRNNSNTLLVAVAVAASISVSLSLLGLSGTESLRGAAGDGCSRSLVIDDGGCGHRFTGSWKANPEPHGYENDQWFSSPQPKTVDSHSVWEFKGVKGREYIVYATWAKRPDSVAVATNAPFTIRDGTKVIETVRVDQKSGPNVEGSVPYGGRNWVKLGKYAFFTDTAVINLRNLANGQVIADAVRLSLDYRIFLSSNPATTSQNPIQDYAPVRIKVGNFITFTRHDVSGEGNKEYQWKWDDSILECKPLDYDPTSIRCRANQVGHTPVSVKMFPVFPDGTRGEIESNIISVFVDPL